MVSNAALPLLLTTLLLAGCGSEPSSQREPLTTEQYHEYMQIGDFADLSNADLDIIGRAFCEDLDGMKRDQRGLAVLVLREQVDSELEAFQAAGAMTGRWCPKYFDDFPLQELGE